MARLHVVDPWRSRWAALVLLAALCLHAGRYALVPEHHEEDGTHSYLQFVLPLVVAGVLLSVGQFANLLRLARRGSLRSALPRPGRWRLWARTSLVLLSVYVVQETGEALSGGGDAHEVFALFGHGAWVVIPLAIALGGLVALALRSAAAVLAWVVRRHVRRLRPPQSFRLVAPPRLGRPASIVARRLAPRGPPQLLST